MSEALGQMKITGKLQNGIYSPLILIMGQHRQL